MEEDTQKSQKKQTSFCEIVRFERLRNSMTQTDLANFLSISRQTVSSWEKGTRVPDVATMEALAEVLHTSVNRLLGGKETEAPGKANNAMDSDEIARQLALLNARYMERISEKRKNWRISLTILVIVVVLSLIILVVRFYIFSYRSASGIETNPIAEATSILDE